MKANVTGEGILLIVFLTISSVTLLAAQDAAPEKRRDRVLDRIEMMRMWRMTDALNLTEEEGAALFPFLRDLDGKRRDLNEERGWVMRELRDTIKGENPDPEAVNGLIDRLTKVRAGIRDLEDRELKRVREILDPEQVARYIVFERDFEQEIRDLIFQARHPDELRRGREGREHFPGNGPQPQPGGPPR